MLKAHISVWFLQELYLIHSFYLLRFFILFVFLKLMAHNIIISYVVIIALSLSGIVLPLSIRSSNYWFLQSVQFSARVLPVLSVPILQDGQYSTQAPGSRPSGLIGLYGKQKRLDCLSLLTAAFIIQYTCSYKLSAQSYEIAYGEDIKF